MPGILLLIFGNRLSADDHKFSATIRAFDAESGKQIDELIVIPSDEVLPGRLPIRWQVERVVRLSGEENRFDKFLEMRNFKLRIEAKGYLPFVTPPLSRQEDVPIEVKLTPGSGVRGIVLQPDGKPAVGAAIVLATNSNQISVYNGDFLHSPQWRKIHPTIQTGEDGTFELHPECDDGEIVISHQTGYFDIDAEECQAGENSFQLIPWGKIEGEFTAGFDVEKEGRIELVRNRKSFSEARLYVSSHLDLITDQEGRFSSNRITPGDYRVSPYFESQDRRFQFLPGTSEFRVAPGETVSVNLPRLGKIVTGIVSIPAGQSFNQDNSDISIKISLAPSLSQVLGTGSPDSRTNVSEVAYEKFLETSLGKLCTRSNLTPDAEGKFEVTGLPEGKYEIVVVARDRSPDSNMQRGKMITRLKKRFTLPLYSDESKTFELPDLVLREITLDSSDE